MLVGSVSRANAHSGRIMHTRTRTRDDGGYASPPRPICMYMSLCLYALLCGFVWITTLEVGGGFVCCWCCLKAGVLWWLYRCFWEQPRLFAGALVGWWLFTPPCFALSSQVIVLLFPAGTCVQSFVDCSDEMSFITPRSPIGEPTHVSVFPCPAPCDRCTALWLPCCLSAVGLDRFRCLE